MKARTLRIALALALAAAPALAQRRPGSVYDVGGPGNLVAARIAARKGDIVTVLISETQNVRNQEASDLSRGTSLAYQLDNFDIAPSAFNPLPKIDAKSSDTFAGQASYEKSGEFKARLAAVVDDVLPNGNLVIRGRREIKIDDETKLIEITGVVRRFDISAGNTVPSELVADAHVVYRGNGPLTKHTNRYGVGRWIHDAIAWLWPF